MFERCCLPQELIIRIVVLQMREMYVMGLGLLGPLNYGEWTC